ncbi:hypothetical protein [Endozoicomonas elysicola]|uniref:Uncharacterized protein n=1 Tax=Endozoicomonas elysicola TaxID=305900 RepID=A0A081K7L1_9GAMM|nr:hypothetical protein [Endozoicomonas elysicola]KEI70137.1 hypothetical protein GV64_04680 [Endozoicomonas elysicola]
MLSNLVSNLFGGSGGNESNGNNSVRRDSSSALGYDGVSPAPGVSSFGVDNATPFPGDMGKTDIEKRGIKEAPSTHYVSGDLMPMQTAQSFPSAPPSYENSQLNHINDQLSTLQGNIERLSRGDFFGRETEWLNYLNDQLRCLSDQVLATRAENPGCYDELCAKHHELSSQLENTRMRILDFMLLNQFEWVTSQLGAVLNTEIVESSQVKGVELGLQALSKSVQDTSSSANYGQNQERLARLQNELQKIRACAAAQDAYRCLCGKLDEPLIMVDINSCSGELNELEGLVKKLPSLQRIPLQHQCNGLRGKLEDAQAGKNIIDIKLKFSHLENSMQQLEYCSGDISASRLPEARRILKEAADLILQLKPDQASPFNHELGDLSKKLDSFENKSNPKSRKAETTQHRKDPLDSGVGSVREQLSGFQNKMSSESAQKSVRDLGRLLMNFQVNNQNDSGRHPAKVVTPKLTELAFQVAKKMGAEVGAQFHSDLYVDAKVRVEVSKSQNGEILPVIKRINLDEIDMSPVMRARMVQSNSGYRSGTVPGYIVYLVADDKKAFGDGRSFKLQLKTDLTPDYANKFSQSELGKQYCPLGVNLKIPEGLEEGARYFENYWIANTELRSSTHSPFAFGQNHGDFKEDIGILDVSRVLRSTGVDAKEASSALSGQVIPVVIELKRQPDHVLDKFKPPEIPRAYLESSSGRSSLGGGWLENLIPEGSCFEGSVVDEDEDFEPESCEGDFESELCEGDMSDDEGLEPECEEGGVFAVGLDTTTAHGTSNRHSADKNLITSPAFVFVRTISPGNEGVKSVAELERLMNDRTADIQRNLSQLKVM